MTATFFAIFAILAYLTSAGLTFKPLPQADYRRLPVIAAWLAAGFHFLSIALKVYHSAGINFSFFSTASLVSLIVCLIVLIAMVNKPLASLGIFIFPVTALMLALELYFPGKIRPLGTYSWQMNVHISTSIIAFSLLNIAAIQAILLHIQNQQLKSHPPKRYIRSMPPLQSMESLLFQMIAAGLALLTLALGTGFVFVNNLFAQHLAHKTFFSILAWLVFSGLLMGRWRYGWRGATAIKWTLLGFLFLLLAYFGSKLVMEIILKR